MNKKYLYIGAAVLAFWWYSKNKTNTSTAAA